MNFSTIKKANWIITTVLLATSGMLASSCSKEKNVNVEQTEDHEGTNLVLSISGINENTGDVVKSASTGKSAKLNVQSYSDVDVVTAVDNNVPFTAASGVAVKGFNGSGQVAAASSNLRAAALANGVTYRLYLLSSDGTQVISSQQFTVGGTTTTIPVTHGTTYKWVALSYNNQDAIPTITTGNTSLLLPENKDVLYASGNVTIPNTPDVDVSLPITFNHTFSRLALELNSMGVFGPMNSGTVSVSGLTLRTGTLNLATGGLTPSATTFTPTINWNSFTNIDPTYSDAKIAYAYTAGTTALSNVVMSVSNLAITHADNVNRTFGSTAPINIAFTSVTPELGKSHRLLANIVESAITSTGSTVKWSRSNLYYTAGHNPYRFFAENKQRSEAGSYFAYGAVVPGQFAPTSGYADPCALVYPAGLWRKPTHADFSTTAYVSSNALLTDVLQNITDLLIGTKAPNSSPNPVGDPTGNYIQYTTTSTANAAFTQAASNNLRFYYNGQLAKVSVLPTNFLTLDLTAIQTLLGLSWGRESALWTSDAPNSILGLVNLGTWGYLAVNKQPLLTGRIATAQGTAELLSTVSLLGIDVASSTLKNVRCVRTN